MGFVALGINHKTAPVEVRERFSFTNKKAQKTLIELKKIDSITGAVILSTCNRTEIYIYFPFSDIGGEKIEEFFLNLYPAPTQKATAVKPWCGVYPIERSDLRHYFYILKDMDVVRHLFRVSSGLDSQVLGETEILGQVRIARQIAVEACAISIELNKLFEKAIEAGRKVRAETKISHGNISIGSVAIKMLEEKFTNTLKDKSILIIGAGKIASLVSRYLKEKGNSGIFVSSRTYEKACGLAEYSGGKAIKFAELYAELKKVDIVISSTSSPHLILKKEAISEIMKEREKPLFIMDLAIPRDIDPEARHIPGISLYDLDDLKSVIEENYNRRRKEAELAERLIEEELKKFSEEIK